MPFYKLPNLKYMQKEISKYAKKIDDGKLLTNEYLISEDCDWYMAEKAVMDSIHFLIKFDDRIPERLHDKLMKLDILMKREYFDKWLRELTEFEYFIYKDRLKANLLLFLVDVDDDRNEIVKYLLNSAIDLKEQGKSFYNEFKKQYDEYVNIKFNEYVSEIMTEEDLN